MYTDYQSIKTIVGKAFGRWMALMHPFPQRLHSFITRVGCGGFKAYEGDRRETEKLFLVLLESADAMQ